MSGPAGPGAGESGPEEPGAGEPEPLSRRPKLAHVSQNSPQQVARLAGAEVREIRPAGSQHQWAHYQVTLADGHPAFAKAARQDLGSVFEAEARGLRWLADAHAVPLPEVLGWDTATLAVTWLLQQDPDQHAAEQFGRDLAVLHASGAERFGTPWPGFIATLPLGDRSGDTVTVAAEATLPGPVASTSAAAAGPGHADEQHGQLGQLVREQAAAAVLAPGRWHRGADRLGHPPGRGRGQPDRPPWPGHPSRPGGSTATAGPATCCGPAAGAG